jgi:fucose permease
VSRPPISRPVAAGVVGCLAFLLIGWSGLVVPSLIRSVRDAFGQSDAGIGVFYFLYAASYASGSFGGGFATERLGRRVVLPLAAALLAAGLVAMGTAPGWAIFLLAALPAGFGGGAIDGGVNGLFLDLYRTGRGRALNLLHLFFSLGALSAPLAIGRLVEGGTDWRAVVVGTGMAAVPLAILLATVAMPAGRRARAERGTGPGVAVAPTNPDGPRLGSRLSRPLILLGVAIACYVASEVGVSNWLVRFLDRAALTTATTALALYWGGLAVGRLVSARIADRFDHLAFTIVWVVAMSLTLAAAILVPSLEASIGLFALAGFASGPVFPMIVALGGERYPDRSAAVSGFLAGVAVVGSVVYPPVMGFLSVGVGLTVAMLGNVVLGLAAAVALAATGARLTDPRRRLP